MRYMMLVEALLSQGPWKSKSILDATGNTMLELGDPRMDVVELQ
jgi:hypothetical protein